MRQLASFLLVALAVPAMATEVWRWKDANGVVHYSDRPAPGAQRVNPAPGEQPVNTGPSILPTAVMPPAAPPPVKFVYSACTVEAPGNDQVFNAVNSVLAVVKTVPGLQPDHLLQVILDGAVYGAWPPRMLTFKLDNIYRGTHTLRVVVLDAAKQPLCDGPPVSFHVRQPSILSPARQPAANPPPAPAPAKP